MVTLEELAMFVAVAEERHFGRAAERCGVSTSALSKRIRHLEVVVGTPVFDRTSRRVSLTPAGQLLVDRAREVLVERDSFERLAAVAASGKAGRLRLLYRVNHAPFVSELIKSLSGDGSDLDLDCEEFQGESIVDEVLAGRASLGLTAEPLRTVLAGIVIQVSCYDTIMVPKEHRLAGATAATPLDIDGEVVIWAGADPTELWATEFGVTVDVRRVRIAGRDDYSTRVEIGQGIGFVTSSTLPAYQHREAVPVPLADPRSWVRVEQRLCWRADDDPAAVRPVVDRARHLAAAVHGPE